MTTTTAAIATDLIAHKRLYHLFNQLSINTTSSSSNEGHDLRRCVIVTGVRTPFVKSFSSLIDVDSIGLSVAAISGLLTKTKLDPHLIDSIIMGNVVVTSAAPNLARESILDLKLPRHIPGTTVSMACLSGLEAIAIASNAIETNNGDIILAGGSDSLSNGELSMPRKATRALGKYQMGGGNKKGWSGLREAISEAGGLSPSNWIPVPNSIAERSTGKTMGYHADLMAEINKIAREKQDEFAVRSHKNAAAAQKKGFFKDEVVPVINGKKQTVDKDSLIRESMDVKKVSQLPPAFRPVSLHGTVNAASSSALTDGASACLLMSEEKAKELGYPTDVSIKAYIKTAIEPYPQLLLAPAIAIPRCLDKAGLTLDDIDLFEIHEAFAAQVLATIHCLKDPHFCKNVLKRDSIVGEIPMNKVNLNGGSLAIGHPFAATGGRLVASLTQSLRRTKKRYGLISICAAGGLGGVAILERIEQ